MYSAISLLFNISRITINALSTNQLNVFHGSIFANVGNFLIAKSYAYLIFSRPVFAPRYFSASETAYTNQFLKLANLNVNMIMTRNINVLAIITQIFKIRYPLFTISSDTSNVFETFFFIFCLFSTADFKRYMTTPPVIGIPT